MLRCSFGLLETHCSIKVPKVENFANSWNDCKFIGTPCKKFIENTRSLLEAHKHPTKKRAGINYWQLYLRIDNCCTNENSELSYMYFIYKHGDSKRIQWILDPYNIHKGVFQAKSHQQNLPDPSQTLHLLPTPE